MEELVLCDPHVDDPSLYGEMGEDTLVVPDNSNRWSEEMEESGGCVSELTSVSIRGKGGGGCRLLLFREFLGQFPMGGSWPSSRLDCVCKLLRASTDSCAWICSGYRDWTLIGGLGASRGRKNVGSVMGG